MALYQTKLLSFKRCESDMLIYKCRYFNLRIQVQSLRVIFVDKKNCALTITDVCMYDVCHTIVHPPYTVAILYQANFNKFFN